MLRKILVVEDNAINRRILCNMLKNEYQILEAENGEAALQILRRKHKVISAVLLDIVMPVLNGFDVLVAMRKVAVLAQIPVIVTTGLDAESAEVKALSLGANDFVNTPYNPVVIRHRLRNTINMREIASTVNAIERDRLTGLYNREAFFEKAGVMLRDKAPGYYVMSSFDLDGFKVINDQYGAEEGDRILRATGKALMECVSALGGLCSRISADNFALLYPAGEREADFVTQKRDSFFKSLDTRCAIVCSVGRYVVSDLSLSVSAIYDRAFLAKQSVKGRYDAHVAYFNESMREKLIGEKQIIGDMNAALALHQFEVWLQPQFNHASGALIGAEALVRWRHPDKGLIPPNKFIPVFEQNGFIYELDKYVWTRVCALLRRWLDEGRSPLPISVNVSRYDVYKPQFYSFLTGLMRQYRIPTDLLRLEITESAFAKSPKTIIDMVKRLMKYGFTVEIDDFGSGYSSLNTLKDVPATVLKLDMMFFKASDDTKRSGNIVESVVRMAKWLDMTVIAEGVEDRAQADYLKTIGCCYIQGFLYAQPMPISDYEALARGNAKEERLLTLETVENLDNNRFWDPSSMDTLIFNSYVGGACIFEYHNGDIELLRANDQYARIIAGVGMSLHDALGLAWKDHLDEKNLTALRDGLALSLKTGESVTSEYVFIDLPGCPHETFLRSTIRVIVSSGDHYLVYCTNENITPQRQAEIEEHKTAEQLRFLNEVAHDLLAQPDSDRGLQGVLQKLLQYFDANRAYIFEMDYEKGVASNTYEACADGVTHEKERLQCVPLEIYAFWTHAFDSQNFVNIPDVDALDDSRAQERETLQAQGIRSLVAVPLQRDGNLIGIISIDDPRVRNLRIDRFVALGDYIAVMLTRRDLNKKILSDNQTLLGLMNDTPGGFARMRVCDDGTVKPVYENEGFCKLVMMNRDEIAQSLGKDALSGVHPDDRHIVQDAVNDMLKNGEARSSAYRLRTGRGDYVRVMFFGRASRDEKGDTFLNIYFTGAAR